MSVLKYYDEKSKAYRSLPLGCESVAVANWNYSEDEQIIGSWTDGRPVYRKTYITSMTIIEGNNEIDASLSGVYVVNFKGRLTTRNEGYSSILPYTDGVYTVLPFYENGLFAYCNKTGLGNVTIYITIEYTKTTDAENSFSIDMLSSGDLDTTATDEEVAAVFA